jgi:hypothetical protein
MSTTVPLVSRPLCASVAARPAPVGRRIRWAALAVAATVVLVLAWPGAWLGVAALLAPDLPLLAPGAWGERGRLRPGAVPFYNAGHMLAGPLLLVATGAVLGVPTVVGVGAGWLVHVAVDRTAGYDLRDRNGDVRR